MKIPRFLYQTTRTKFKEFCKHCTFHGTYYFYETSQRWVHAIWTLVILSSLSLCCFLSHMIWDKYADDPTLTLVETTRYSTAEIPFPAVTLCDTDPVYLPNTNNVTKLLKLRGYNQSQVTEFYQSFIEVTKQGYTPKTYVRKMHSLLEDLGYSFKYLLYTFKRPCEDMIFECAWRSQVYNCTDMFRSVYTVVGYCCQFDTAFFVKNSNETINLYSGTQSSEALEITVEAKMINDDIGGHVLLYSFDNKEKITLLTNPVIITPDSYFDVNIYLWTIDSSDYVKALSLDKRKCFLDTDFGASSSTYEGCLSRLIMKQVVRACQCLPFDYTAEELDEKELGQCIWERYNCVYENIEKIQADIRPIMAKTECYQRCDFVQYENEIELIGIMKNSRKFEVNRCAVSVHFSESTCIKYRREVLYTWDQMLANLGGIFGLCLGGSIISIIELLWFLIELIVTLIHQVFQKRKMTKGISKLVKNKGYYPRPRSVSVICSLVDAGVQLACILHTKLCRRSFCVTLASLPASFMPPAE